MKHTIFASMALGLCTIGLSACGQEQEQAVAPEGVIPGVSVSNARLVLPAVEGNPGVLYFDAIYNGDDYLMLRKVQIEGASGVQLHESVETNGVSSMQKIAGVNFNKGEPVKFEPGGKHIMVMKLDPSLVAGGTAKVVLTFVGGDQHLVNAAIEAPGGAD